MIRSKLHRVGWWFLRARVPGLHCFSPSRGVKATTQKSAQVSRTALSSGYGVAYDPDSKKKRKCSLLVCYDGFSYRGLQKQSGDIPTVESVLERALHQEGLISDSNFGDMGKIGWSRSSRTDAGVHAVGLCVSAKLLLDPLPVVKGGHASPQDRQFDLSGLPDKINTHLPDNVSVVDMQLVRKKFMARTSCELRTYEYLAPAEWLDENFTVSDPSPSHSYSGHGTDNQEPVWPADADFDIEKAAAYLVGCHSYNNFTNKSKTISPRKIWRPPSKANPDSRDMEADAFFDNFSSYYYREIISIAISRVAVHGRDFVKFRLQGNSFLFHQIRKIVGLLIAVARRALPSDVAHLATGPWTIPTPLAPPHYLLLDHTPNAFQTRGVNDFPVGQEVVAKLSDFKTNVVYKNMVANLLDEEIQQARMLEFAYLLRHIRQCQQNLTDIEALREKNKEVLQWRRQRKEEEGKKRLARAGTATALEDVV